MKLGNILFLSLALLFSCNSEEVAQVEEEKKQSQQEIDYVVTKDGSGDFESVQEAFDAVKFWQSERTNIYVKNGTYKEVLVLEKNKNKISLIGESAEGVVLTFDNYASRINPETGEEYGTSGSSSNYIYGDEFFAQNITFENSAGPVGQALAIYIGGDKAVFDNCRFIGWQDTMYGGRSRQYFKDCYIEGSTDFIFGPSTAFFDNCELFTKGGSAMTAASTEEYVTYGYVFKDCKITGTGPNITTLGRPWRPYAAVTFIDTEMSSSIKPVGWDNWGNPDNEATARYAEYGSSGEGGTTSQRVEWAEILTKEEAELYTIQNVLRTKYKNPPVVDDWNPLEVLEETRQLTERN